MQVRTPGDVPLTPERLVHAQAVKQLEQLLRPVRVRGFLSGERGTAQRRLGVEHRERFDVGSSPLAEDGWALYLMPQLLERISKIAKRVPIPGSNLRDGTVDVSISRAFTQPEVLIECVKYHCGPTWRDVL